MHQSIHYSCFTSMVNNKVIFKPYSPTQAMVLRPSLDDPPGAACAVN
ncbi:MAG: hypothetical protein H7320_11105 [Ferruginibacter sp.]|nr:hypothetical protein [Ferruginibacter sp.]